jgi:LuxR family transcriptional regulator, maltose regulon positive regulatory protein
LRLFLARRLNDFPVVVEEAQRLFARTETADTIQIGLGEDLRAATLISLGIAEIWAFRFEDAERHLEQGVDLARQIGRPYLELYGLAHGAHWMLLFRPDAAQAERSWQAIELAERHGWDQESLAGMAYAQLGIMMLYQGRLAEAEPWLERAERTLRTEVEPAAGMSLRCARAVLELARGRYQEALAAFRGAEKLAATLVGPHTCVTSMRSWMLRTLVRPGQTERTEQVLAELGEDERASAEMRTAVAALRLASEDPQAAADALAPVLDLLLRPATAVPPPTGRAGWARGRGLDEQLTDSETRVLRYLPTHLTGPEIAAELWLSVNTVSTHTRHLYAKLGVHNRHEAVDRARALGLLAPSARRA